MLLEGFRIRDYRPEDFIEIETLWGKTGLLYPGRDDTNESILNTFKFGGKLLVLEDTERKIIVGTSWLTCDGRRIHIHHMAIKQGYQGKGLGKYLAGASLEYCKQMGFQARLDVHKNNEITKHIYGKLGFYTYDDYDIMVIRKY